MPLALVRHIPDDTSIPFIQGRLVAFFVSLAFMIGSAGAFLTFGLNFGIDFRGGTVLEIETDGPADIGAVRETIDALGLGDVQVQGIAEPGADLTVSDNLVLIQVEAVEPEDLAGFEGVRPENAEEAQQAARLVIQTALNEAFPGVEYRRVEVVGPKVSGELVRAGTMAVLAALVMMLIYIWFRFEWQYSVGAVVALAHDVIATIGMFAVTQLEFNLSTIAAILTIVGYSMNDTVVVYDRIREKFRKFKSKSTPDVLNLAINKTLSRTILTSGTTLVAVIALAVIGGAALQGFAIALIWGVLIGTYSSIFVAAPLLMVTGVKREASEEGERAGGAPATTSGS